MSDLVERARNYANLLNITWRNELKKKRPSIEDHAHQSLLRQLADEIERLRARVEEFEREES